VEVDNQHVAEENLANRHFVRYNSFHGGSVFDVVVGMFDVVGNECRPRGKCVRGVLTSVKLTHYQSHFLRDINTEQATAA